MGWPYTLESTIPSKDMNDLFDGVHGDQVRNLGPSSVGPNNTVGSFSSNGNTLTFTADTQYCMWPIELLEGDRLRSVTLRIGDNDGSQTVDLEVFKLIVETATSLDDGTSTGAQTTLTLSGIDYDVEAGASVFAKVFRSGAGGDDIDIQGVSYTFDRPPPP